MRKITLIMVSILTACVVVAQKPQIKGHVSVVQCAKFSVTKPLNEIVAASGIEDESGINSGDESPDGKYRKQRFVKKNEKALPLVEDPALQKSKSLKQLSSPIAVWQGQYGGNPPDPTGAAGPDHFIQAINTKYRIYSKSGTTVPGGGPFSLGALLFGVNAGDPVVLYDKYADRWFISQFDKPDVSNNIYIAISKTSDPTGQYYTYQFSSPSFPDYLKFSIWSDGYYMTSNQDTQRIFAFEREQMLLGNPDSRAIASTFTAVKPEGPFFFCPLSADADGQLPPVGTPCPIFSLEDDGWGVGFEDRINIYEMNINWDVVPSTSITLAAQLPTAPFDASGTPYLDDITQPGSSQKLDALTGFFMFRAQYRRWTGYNAVVLNNSVLVNTNTGQRGIRWYELRQDEASGEWSIYQQSTYSPDALSRWNGSIAMDDNGSIGMAYAVTGVDGVNSVYPSIRYTGRLANDPLNQLTYEEQLVAEGNSPRTGGNRYGDYSHTSIDPVDGTIFWHTGEYILNSGSATKIFSFRIETSNGIDENVNASNLTVNNSNGILVVKADHLPSNNDLIVDLFDVAGRKLSSQSVVVGSNYAETTIPVQGLVKGMYLVRIGNLNTSFQKVVKLLID